MSASIPVTPGADSSTFSTSAVNLFESPCNPWPHLWGPASALGATGSVGTRLNGFFSGGQARLQLAILRPLRRGS